MDENRKLKTSVGATEIKKERSEDGLEYLVARKSRHVQSIYISLFAKHLLLQQIQVCYC